jgi:hypothetical protein
LSYKLEYEKNKILCTEAINEYFKNSQYLYINNTEFYAISKKIGIKKISYSNKILSSLYKEDKIYRLNTGIYIPFDKREHVIYIQKVVQQIFLYDDNAYFGCLTGQNILNRYNLIDQVSTKISILSIKNVINKSVYNIKYNFIISTYKDHEKEVIKNFLITTQNGYNILQLLELLRLSKKFLLDVDIMIIYSNYIRIEMLDEKKFLHSLVSAKLPYGRYYNVSRSLKKFSSKRIKMYYIEND